MNPVAHNTTKVAGAAFEKVISELHFAVINAAEARGATETHRKQFMLSLPARLTDSFLLGAIMGYLNTDTLIFVIALITVCCFFLGHAMDNILADEGYGPYGNMAVMWAGFIAGLYAMNHLGFNMRDFKLAAFGGLIGSFSLLGLCVLIRSLFRRYVA
jgi:hypothetical protein